MAERKGIYFVSDVHIGADVGDPAEREDRFVNFLRSIPKDTAKAVYMLGDIWDLWYEYKDLVPKDGARVIALMAELADSGVEVHFFPGNHDMWVSDFFEKIGVVMHEQPCFVNIEGKEFCLGHGDIVGGTSAGYRFLHWVYTSPVIQFIFSLLHPRILFAMSRKWFRISRNSHKPFEFIPERQKIVRWAKSVSAERKVDFFVFGHFHCNVDIILPSGSRFLITEDWVNASPYLFFDGETLSQMSFGGLTAGCPSR